MTALSTTELSPDLVRSLNDILLRIRRLEAGGTGDSLGAGAFILGVPGSGVPPQLPGGVTIGTTVVQPPDLATLDVTNLAIGPQPPGYPGTDYYMSVTWSIPTAPGSPYVAGYRVSWYVTSAGVATAQFMDVKGVDVNSVTIRPVRPNTSYTITVQVYDQLHNLSPGVSATYTTGTTALPPIVTGLAGGTSGPNLAAAFGIVIATWLQSTSPDVAWANGTYRVQLDSASTFSSGAGGAPLYSVDIPGLAHSFTALPANVTTWYCRVAAIGGSSAQAGITLQGPWSATSSISSVAGYGPSGGDGHAPSANPATVTTIPALTYAVVSWVPPASPGTIDQLSYDVHLSTAAGFTPSSATLVGNVSGTSMAVNHLPGSTTALDANTLYYFTVVSRDADGLSTSATYAYASCTVSSQAYPLGNLAGAAAFTAGIKSSNFVSGSSGWAVDGAGNVEFNNGTFRGGVLAGTITATGTISGATLSGGSINIGSGAFNVDGSGNVTITRGSIGINGGVFSVNSAGALVASNVQITGGSLVIGGNFSVNTAGILTATGMTIGGNAQVTGTLSGGTILSGDFCTTSSTGRNGINHIEIDGVNFYGDGAHSIRFYSGNAGETGTASMRTNTAGETIISGAGIYGAAQQTTIIAGFITFNVTGGITTFDTINQSGYYHQRINFATTTIKSLGSGATLQLRDNNDNNSVTFACNTVDAATKNFVIPHPARSGYELVFSSVEGPRPDLLYRGHVTLAGGSATINIDAVYGLFPGTFASLTLPGSDVFLNSDGASPVSAKLVGPNLTITSTDQTATVTWLVIAERGDADMLKNHVAGKFQNERLPVAA